MLFNSLEFLIFLPVVFLVFYLAKHSWRWVILLAASYYFYMAWKPAFIVLIIGSTVVDYWCSRGIEKASDPKRKKLLLWTSLLTNLGLLLTFKYLGFFHQVAQDIGVMLGAAESYGPIVKLLLPMGISFYTFQTMSYTVDVYNGKIKPEKHFGVFALFVTFFPQLVAGPIERASSLLPQLKAKVSFNYDNITSGLKLATWGMFKKVVIADRLSVLVDSVYNSPYDHDGIALIIGTVLFAFQIFCDFSGYSDIAIGIAKMFGVNLMENFRRPYHAQTISEFWKRWHISLSTWFRDYVYIPMGGSRTVKWRWYYNLFITFLVSGFWHGAEWTFIIWGAFHGVLLIIGVVFDTRKMKAGNFYQAIRVVRTFVMVCLGWVFFRASNATEAWYIITHSFQHLGQDLQSIISNQNFARSKELYLGQDKWILIIGASSIIVMEIIHLIQRRRSLRDWVAAQPVYVRWPLYYGAVLVICAFGVFDKSQFIYFQF